MKAPDPTEVMDLGADDLEVLDAAPKFRIKVDMDEDDREALQTVMDQVNATISTMFAQTFANERKLLDKVRAKTPDGDWVRNPDGSFIEDWNGLDMADLEDFLLASSSDVFFGSQRVIDTLGEASFSKLIYDDAYDAAYSSQLRGTINDKQARARRETIDERYVSLYKSLLWQRAKQVIDRADQHVRRVEAIYRERAKALERSIRASRERF